MERAVRVAFLGLCYKVYLYSGSRVEASEPTVPQLLFHDWNGLFGVTRGRGLSYRKLIAQAIWTN